VAGGIYDAVRGTRGNQTGLLEDFAHGSWTAAATPLPEGPDSALVNVNAVSCGSAVSCVAVGVVSNDTGGEPGALFTLANGRWRYQAAPVDTLHINADLAGVSCVSAGSCVAVGDYADEIGHVHPLVVDLRSGFWTDVHLPTSTQQDTAEELNAVACTAVEACVAGGTIDGGTSPNDVLLQDRARVWTVVPAPSPANVSSDIDGVSCPMVASCVATGTYYTTASGLNGLTLGETNGTWSVATASWLPAGVSCGSDGFCLSAPLNDFTGDGLVESGTNAP
jgi:hypothetical protein